MKRAAGEDGGGGRGGHASGNGGGGGGTGTKVAHGALHPPLMFGIVSDSVYR